MSGEGERYVRVPGEVFALVAGRKLTTTAAWLYGVMLGYVNHKRGDTDVWPRRRVLADALGMKNVGSVDRYVDELVRVGLVERVHRTSVERGHESNIYRLASVVGASGQMTARGGASGQTAARGSRQMTARLAADRPPLEQEEVELDEVEPDEPLSPATPTAAASSSQSRADARRESAPQVSKRRTRDSLDPRGEWCYEFRILVRNGLDRRYASKVYDHLHDSITTSTRGFYIAAEKNGSIGDLISEALEEMGLPANLYQPLDD